MISDILFFLVLIVSFLPFILFAFFNSKANVNKENRNRQYAMPVVAVIYSVVLLIFLDKVSALLLDLFLMLADLFDKINFSFGGDIVRNLYSNWGIYLTLVLFNTAALIFYVIIKRILTAIMGKISVPRKSFIGSVVELFYNYDEMDEKWYIKAHFGQARTFIKTAYYGGCFISGLALLISCGLCMHELISAPFYPVFAVIIIGEMAFFIDGLEKDELKSNLQVQTDKSHRIAMYSFLRKPLKALFGDKLAAEGTTVNNSAILGGAIEDILASLEKNGGHIGRNYAAFIHKKMDKGLKPNVDYIRCGYDLATGKSLLFNTPFYDKLNPYVFYALNRELITGRKVLIVLGRHGTEEDLLQWSQEGMKAVSNIPDLWKIDVLNGNKINEEDLPDIGIISRSGVHDLDIHKNNLPFLRKVSFVIVVEPSKLVTTAQIGLNLLIKCCGKERSITFCSVDRNCDGLVDALSHILMTNITEVSATEYPHGTSSYMFWTADDDYLQHRILPGVSRYLGMGTELSMVALKNQVKKTVWYGGEVFPVLDAHWIAKQYYYDLLDYTQLPTNQETFDICFQTSFNMCNERVGDYSFITVEDDRNNLFETRRNFATIAEQQGFVNVISSEYMLREYMADNPEIFTADPKAIPYITADHARTKRNSILSLCLLLCIDSVQEEALLRQLQMLNIDTKDPTKEIWKEICTIFGCAGEKDKEGNHILSVKNSDNENVSFEKNTTIIFKREYNIESGKFESVYTIENADFSRIILDDLQNASYIAEQESKDVYIGTELKGHVYQKYMPGQFFTLNGKYYEMVSTASDNRILVRRASEHIDGRLSYRQVRNYTINRLENSTTMGALKSVNNIDIHYQYADFSVETPGYWKLRSYNDFDNGDLIRINGIPNREYHHKQILKFDFSKFGDAFTDSVRMTLTNLLNEAFVTLFADNQPFISAVTPGKYDAPLTYSLELSEELENADKCIFIIEDSQLDIGLLISVERNLKRIFQIISDYLTWNEEKIAESLRPKEEPEEVKEQEPFSIFEDEEEPKKKGFFGKIGDWFKGIFKKKKKAAVEEIPAQDYMMIYGRPHKLVKGKWVSCTQEEFDEKMAKRHQMIEEKSQAEKANSEEKEASEGNLTIEATEQSDDACDSQTEDPFAGMTEKERKKAEKAARKAAKKAEKEAARAAKRAKKAGKNEDVAIIEDTAETDADQDAEETIEETDEGIAEVALEEFTEEKEDQPQETADVVADEVVEEPTQDANEVQTVDTEEANTTDPYIGMTSKERKKAEKAARKAEKAALKAAKKAEKAKAKVVEGMLENNLVADQQDIQGEVNEDE